MMTNEEWSKKSQELYFAGKELIGSLTYLGERFCKEYCLADGLTGIYHKFRENGQVPDDFVFNAGLQYDFRNYAFAKSIKSIKAIECLVNDEDMYFGEDVMVLSRTILENHLLARFFWNCSERDKKKYIKSMLQGPLAKEHGIATFTNNSFFIDGNDYGHRIGVSATSTTDMGIYAKGLMAFLSDYVHLNFGKVDNYILKGIFTPCLDRDALVSIVIAVFCSTKIYETTVNNAGEDFESKKEAKQYCDLTYDALEYLYSALSFLIQFFSERECKVQDAFLVGYYGCFGETEKIKTGQKYCNLFKTMRASLDDDTLSDLIKTKDKDGKYIRKYIY